MPPTSITLIRHGEKPPDTGAPRGIQDTGEHDDHSLIVRGWQRAGALAVLFGPAVGPMRPGIRRPTQIVCADYPDDIKHHRVYETVSPLADRLRLRIEHPLAVDEAKHLYHKHLAHSDGDVLVCWEHLHIPSIAAAIPLSSTSPEQPPTTFPNAFDLIWMFTSVDDGYDFTSCGQQLLVDDSDT